MNVRELKDLGAIRITKTKRFVALGLIVAGVWVGTLLAQAEDMVPWKGTSTGQATPASPTTFWVVEAGSATHVGDFTETATPDGSIEITAANGDKLFGQSTIIAIDGSVVTVKVVFSGGTGRFAGATGGYIGTLTVDWTTLTFTATSTGTISTVGSKKK